jgi:hypothetical protein
MYYLLLVRLDVIINYILRNAIFTFLIVLLYVVSENSLLLFEAYYRSTKFKKY